MNWKKKKKSRAVLLAAQVLMMSVTGCGDSQIPELTDAQVQMVGEYVAATVMKYQAGGKSRLVDLYETDFLQPAAPVPTQVLDIQEPDESTPVTDNSDQSIAVENQYSLEEVLGLSEGLKISYRDYKICDSYPEETDAFVIDASTGNKLLVLNFALDNTTGQDQEVDILSLGAIFGITVNGTYIRRALPTIIENELSTFQGTLPADGSVEVVLIIQVGEDMAGSVSSISLNVKNDSKAYTIQLL